MPQWTKIPSLASSYQVGIGRSWKEAVVGALMEDILEEAGSFFNRTEFRG
jgi:hypothetical protein